MIDEEKFKLLQDGIDLIINSGRSRGCIVNEKDRQNIHNYYYARVNEENYASIMRGIGKTIRIINSDSIGYIISCMVNKCRKKLVR